MNWRDWPRRMRKYDPLTPTELVKHEFWMIVFANWTIEELCVLDQSAWGYSEKA